MSAWNNRTVRELEITSLRAFVESQGLYLYGRVLDFGAGKPGTCRRPQPYRDLVAGVYVPYDLGDPLPAGSFDAVLCTQVLQYVESPAEILGLFHSYLHPGGHLVLTYATNWAEVEDSDLWRFTRAGMQHLLEAAGFAVVVHERRAELDLGGFKLALGYGVIAAK